MAIQRVVIFLTALASAASAAAQNTGTLDYGPAASAAPAPVPIPSLFLLPLGIAMVFFGYRLLRQQVGRQLPGILLLALGAGMGAMSSLHIQEAIAAALIELDNPAGGSVEIPTSDAQYTNTSGVSLKIGAVTAPQSCATSAPAEECVAGLELGDGESCTTVYECTPFVSAISSPSVSEGGSLVYTVTLGNPSATPSSLAYSLGGGSATAADYATPQFSDAVTPVGGHLAVPGATTSFTVTVASVDDLIYEATETLPLTVGGVTATGSILDNDPAPKVIAISVAHVTEGGSLVCTVSLDQAPGGPFRLSYTFGGGTASPADYGLPVYSPGVTVDGGDLLIPAGSSSFSVTLPTVDDPIHEPTETVPFTFGGLTLSGNIYDNDGIPTVTSVSSPVASEGGDLVYSVTLGNASASSINLAYSLGGGSASAADYGAPVFSNGVQLVGGELVVPAGVTSFTVTVATVSDGETEALETLPLLIGGVSGTGSIIP